MATPRKRWPNFAEWARMDSIALAREGRRRLLNEIERIQDLTLLREVTRAVETFREIEAKLKACKD